VAWRPVWGGARVRRLAVHAGVVGPRRAGGLDRARDGPRHGAVPSRAPVRSRVPVPSGGAGPVRRGRSSRAEIALSAVTGGIRCNLGGTRLHARAPDRLRAVGAHRSRRSCRCRRRWTATSSSAVWPHPPDVVLVVAWSCSSTRCGAAVSMCVLGRHPGPKGRWRGRPPARRCPRSALRAASAGEPRRIFGAPARKSLRGCSKSPPPVPRHVCRAAPLQT
jgi:hypothetical protein